MQGGRERQSADLDGPDAPGATNALATDGHQIQYEEGEGPCLDAAMDEGSPARTWQ
jgi:hypothetical protein